MPGGFFIVHVDRCTWHSHGEGMLAESPLWWVKSLSSLWAGVALREHDAKNPDMCQRELAKIG